MISVTHRVHSFPVHMQLGVLESHRAKSGSSFFPMLVLQIYTSRSSPRHSFSSKRCCNYWRCVSQQSTTGLHRREAIGLCYSNGVAILFVDSLFCSMGEFQRFRVGEWSFQIRLQLDSSVLSVLCIQFANLLWFFFAYEFANSAKRF